MKSVQVLLATYKPNEQFFERQIKSINNQSYSNLELIVRDDSDCEDTFIKIRGLLNKLLTDKEFKLFKNETNLGSNITFEKLTEDSTADLVAYCDQDDIWETHKIEVLVEELIKSEAIICYSDLSIIDSNDKKLYKSFKDISKRLKHIYGENVSEYFLRRNSITGCTMLIKSEWAKSSLPFPSYNQYVHDHWLALVSSINGKIAYISEPLVKYRIHDNNQIGANVLANIDDKNSYVKNKIGSEISKVDLLKKRIYPNSDKQIKKQIESYAKYVKVRKEFFEKNNIQATFNMIRIIPKDIRLIIFEILINMLPIKFSDRIIGKVKQ